MSKESESVTFRINLRVLEQLRLGAESDRVSLNTFVNQIFSYYLEWDMHLAAGKFALIQKSLLKEMVKELGIERLREIARRATNVLDLMPLTLLSQNTVDLLRAIVVLAKQSGYLVRIFEDNGQRKIIIRHELGATSSEFYKAQIEQIFRSVNYPIRIENTENSVVIYTDKNLNMPL
jgi:hypothetical protein